MMSKIGKRGRSVYVLFLAVLAVLGMLAVLGGCGRIREAREAVKGVSAGVQAAKQMAESAEGLASSGGAEPLALADLSEKQVRRYYSELAGLRERYPEVEFQVPMTAAMTAGASGKNLEKIIEGETSLSYGEYNQISLTLMTALAETAAAGMNREMTAALESAVTEMEALDTSEMSEEQKKEVEAQIAEQKKALAAAKKTAESPEVQDKAEKLEMILRIRRETGFE